MSYEMDNPVAMVVRPPEYLNLKGVCHSYMQEYGGVIDASLLEEQAAEILKEFAKELEQNYDTVPLLLASSNGDINSLEQWKSNGSLFHSMKINGDSALLSAVINDQRQVLIWFSVLGTNLSQPCTDEGVTPLIAASYLDRNEIVKQLIAGQVNLNTQDKVGRTALMVAAQQGNSNTVEDLIKAGADSNLQTRSGKTALFYAAMMNQKKVIHLLVKSNHELLHLRDVNGRTALAYCGFEGKADAVKLLVELGADVNSTDKHGRTVLLTASLQGYEDIVESLIQENATINLNTKQGLSDLCDKISKPIAKKLDKAGVLKVTTESSLLLASFNKSSHLNELLSFSTDVNALGESGLSPLMLASHCGHINHVESLLEHSADLRLQNKAGLSALAYAIDGGHDKVVDILIGYGANINDLNKQGETLLHIATGSGNYRAVKAILFLGSYIDCKNIEGKTALMIAASKGFSRIVDLFLTMGASTSEFSDEYLDALNYAFINNQINVKKKLEHHTTPPIVEETIKNDYVTKCQSNDIQGVKELLHKGFPVDDHEGRTGKTQLIDACLGGRYELTKLLLNFNANVNARDLKGCTPLIAAAYSGHSKLVKLLIDKAANINACRNSGYNALMGAVKENHLETVSILLESGVLINQKENDVGISALGFAVKNNNTEIAKILLEFGAMVNISDNKMQSPIFYACLQQNRQLVELLVKYKADINHADGNLRTPLMYTAKSGSLNFVKLLVEHGANVQLKSKSGDRPEDYAKRNKCSEVMWYLKEQSSNKIIPFEHLLKYKQEGGSVSAKDDSSVSDLKPESCYEGNTSHIVDTILPVGKSDPPGASPGTGQSESYIEGSHDTTATDKSSNRDLATLSTIKTSSSSDRLDPISTNSPGPGDSSVNSRMDPSETRKLGTRLPPGAEGQVPVQMNFPEDPSIKIYQIFKALLTETGAIHHTDKRIAEKFVSGLEPKEQMTVLQHGSIKDFLLTYDDIILDGGKLKVGTDNEGDIDSTSDLSSEKSNSDEDIDSEEEEYRRVTSCLYKDQAMSEVIQYICRNHRDSKIYITVDEGGEDIVQPYLKKHFHGNEKFVLMSNVKEEDDWLMNNGHNEGQTDVFLPELVGPGSFIMEDKQLEFYKNHCSDPKIRNIKEFLKNNKQRNWGTLGCLAEHPDHRDKLYILSVKHLVSKNIGFHKENDTCMISGFQHNYKMEAENKHLQRFISNETNTVKLSAKDIVFTSRGYCGFLGAFEEGSNIQCADVALYELSKSMILNHEDFNPDPNSLLRVITRSDKDLVGLEVRKCGSATGITKGKIIGTGICSGNARSTTTGQPGNTFFVTSVDRYGNLEENGKFALHGDSGSIVLIDDNRSKLKAVGIIYKLIHSYVYISEDGSIKVLKNIINCVRLDQCLKALKQHNGGWIPQLYYYYFKPVLSLKRQNWPVLNLHEQNVTEDFPPLTFDGPVEVVQSDQDDYAGSANQSEKERYDFYQ